MYAAKACPVIAPLITQGAIRMRLHFGGSVSQPFLPLMFYPCAQPFGRDQ